MRQFIARKPLPDIWITPQEWKSDPEVSIKHDDLYARAWDCEYEQPFFDAEINNATPSNSLETPIRSNLSTDEMRNTPGTACECCLEFFTQTEQLCDVTDTYPDMETDAETSSEQQNNTPTNTLSSQIQFTS